MINNRQNGRRRGRGGGPRSPNAPSPGNRQDNRSRGNASQLHEKYKALARDAQLAGDRVQTEYYLQFADHYFRVLNETRARFEEQRPRREDIHAYEDEESDEAMAAGAEGEEGHEGHEVRERDQRPQRGERGRPRRDDQFEARAEAEEQQSERGETEERAPRPVGELRPRRPRVRREREAEDAGEERISLESLPPAIASVTADSEEAPKPRRRTRRAAPDASEEVAPAA
ncbi:DUF4167 domain-containing protein [Allosphingosinicella humi]